MRFAALLIGLYADYAFPSLWRERLRAASCHWLRQLVVLVDDTPIPALLAVLLVVTLPAFGVGLVWLLLNALSASLAWAFGVGLLYLSVDWAAMLGRLRRIALALSRGDTPLATTLLAGEAAPPEDATITTTALTSALRVVLPRGFAPLFWFAALGAIGVAGYWVASQSAAILRARHGRITPAAERVLAWLDYLPARLAALSFAVVGSFEDAMFAWRTRDQRAGSVHALVAAGAGALALRLPGYVEVGEAATPDDLQSAEALLWRSLILWIASAGLGFFILWALRD